ncbi:MAG: beta strand repeat-containing protein, partial [Beijerinckiaceae bacterium]
SDTTVLVLTGTGLAVSGGVLTAGTVSSIAHRVSLGGADIETFTGLPNYAATFLQSFLTPVVDGAAFQATLFSGADNIFGSSGDDALAGGLGDDFFRGRGGVDILNGGGGNDMASYDQDATNGGSAPVVVNLSSADVNYGGIVTAGTARDGFGDVDTLISIEHARGTAFADIFIGGSTGGFFQGRAGGDTYIGTVPLYADNYFGVPFVDYRQDGGTSGINVNLDTGTGTDTFGATETFQNIASIRGSMFADTITGSQFYNYFQGLQGADIIDGGAGYDRVDYSGDAGFGGAAGVSVDLVMGFGIDGWGNTDTLSNIEYVTGTNSGDSIIGNNSDNFLIGLAGNDSLVGGDGFDVFRVGAGTDSADGSPDAAVDQSYGDRDRIDYADMTPSVTGLGVIVNLGTTNVTFDGFNVAGLAARDTAGFTDTFIDIERVRGTSGRDYMVGSAFANLREERFEGLAGDDYFDGGAGFNIVQYFGETPNYAGTTSGGSSGIIANLSDGTVTVNGFTVLSGKVRDAFGNTDTLVSIQGINGTALADDVTGGAGYNVFRSFGGADYFDGGAGDDDRMTFLRDELLFGVGGAGVTVNMTAGTALQVDGSTATFVNVEDIAGSEGNDAITGDAKDNRLFGDFGADALTGGSGSDTLNGGQGADTLDGGADFDFVSYFEDPTYLSYLALARAGVVNVLPAGTGVTVNLATGTATDDFGNTDALTNIEGIVGSFFSDTLTGDGNANTFLGLSGNDIINGGGGLDTISFEDFGNLIGSGAPDLIGINASRPVAVAVNLGAGTASDGEGGNDTLTSIENVIGSKGADSIIGSSDANVLSGGDGDDIIEGGLGADTMDGGLGIDTLSYSSGDGIGFYALAPSANFGGAAGDTYTGFERLIGSAFGDQIYMDNADNIVLGFGGALDTVFLYGGNDTYTGGSGYDYVLAGVGNDILNIGDGGSLIYGEDGDDAITATGGSNSLYGGAGLDTITGGANQDVIFGGLDADTLSGGDGDDFFFGEAGDDIVHGGLGSDQAQGGVGNDTLNGDSGVDVLLGGDDNDIINGGTDDDFLFGEAGNDTINGGDGGEQIFGGIGNDILNGQLGVDIIYGDDGDDTLNGGLGFDVSAGNVNFLIAGAGNDIVTGTAGQDQMWGGDGVTSAGNDTFVIGANCGFDIIFDFTAGVGLGDVINLVGSSFADFAALQASGAITQAGSYTHIALSAGNDIFLANVTSSTLVADDFVFI